MYWPDDQEYYPCVVTRHRVSSSNNNNHVYTINYEDGEIETVDLAKEKFRIIGGVKRSAAATDANANNAADATGRKRRRILEDTDDDDEEEFESSSSSSDGDTGSEFKINQDESIDDSLDAAEEEADDDDNWLASDEEDDDYDKKSKSLKKTKVTVTQVGGGGDDCGNRFVSPTPRKPSGNTKKSTPAGTTATTTTSTAMDFTYFASQSPTPGNINIDGDNTKSSPTNNNKHFAPTTNGSNSTETAAVITKNAPPKPISGVVNPAGSHLHNHLKFFTTHRKDAHGNPPTHPDFSPRTLQVSFSEIEKESGGKISPAQKQWWDMKSQYADAVLLFKTGKFYEMFHDDADVGVKVLGFVYMKGTSAHAGFPEAAYDKMLTKLVDAGYKVARVEQTETPEDLKERKKSAPAGRKPQVVCREVCSLVSKGTRTFCFLEDATVLEQGNGGGGNGGIRGPLLAIKEFMLDDRDNCDGVVGGNEEEDETGTKAVCEYGVTIVDAVTGVITLGQFADDVLRSRMQTLLASFGPSEVSTKKDNESYVSA